MSDQKETKEVYVATANINGKDFNFAKGQEISAEEMKNVPQKYRFKFAKKIDLLAQLMQGDESTLKNALRQSYQENEALKKEINRLENEIGILDEVNDSKDGSKPGAVTTKTGGQKTEKRV